eukprot:8276309-Pyramimonas_sp.AAC.3
MICAQTTPHVLLSWESVLLQGDHAELERMRDLHARSARLEARNAELEKEMEGKLAEIMQLRAKDLEKEKEVALAAAATREQQHAAQVCRTSPHILNPKPLQSTVVPLERHCLT